MAIVGGRNDLGALLVKVRFESRHFPCPGKFQPRASLSERGEPALR